MQRPAPWLTAVLAADAASCFGLGLLGVGAPAWVSGLLGLPHGFVIAAGMILLAAGVLLVATLARRTVWLLRLVVLGNAAWVAASIATLALMPMTAIGVAAVAAQAAAVAVITAIEARFLRPAAWLAEGAA